LIGPYTTERGSLMPLWMPTATKHPTKTRLCGWDADEDDVGVITGEDLCFITETARHVVTRQGVEFHERARLSGEPLYAT